MKDSRRVIITKKRNVNTYADMWHASWCLLEKGIEDEKGSFYQFMASLVFTAFTLEAYLNHIGEIVFKCWADLERLGPKEKLNILADHLGVKIDSSVRPWQVMKELYGFRNDIAHGKSHVLEHQKVMPLQEHHREHIFGLLPTRWEKYCTRNNAERARTDVETIVRLLHEAAGLGDDYPFIHGGQDGSATLLNNP